MLKFDQKTVVATSFESALDIVRKHYPGVEINSISLQNPTEQILFDDSIPVGINKRTRTKSSNDQDLIAENHPKFLPRTRKARLFDEQDIAKQVWEMYPGTYQRAERAKEWKKRTNGKSERALYRRSANLDLK